MNAQRREAMTRRLIAMAEAGEVRRGYQQRIIMGPLMIAWVGLDRLFFMGGAIRVLGQRRIERIERALDIREE